MNDSPDAIGFIGLGIMGQGMARNLLAAGFPLTVWNRTESRAAPFAEAGAAVGAGPSDVAARSDLVILCVSDTPDVEKVILGPGGVREGARPGTLVVDMSTISPGATRAIAGKLEEAGIHMLDAPVSGGSEGAAAGTLSIMVGGDPTDLERAMPCLRAMGSRITHVGPVGAGQTVKLVNQIVVVLNMLAVSEGLLFAQAAGADLERTLEAIGGGAAGSWMLANRGPQVLQRDWRPGFTIDLQQKDLRLALEAADEVGVPLLGTGLVFQLYRTLQREGSGGDGNHALARALEKLAGVTIGDGSEPTAAPERPRK